MLLGPDAGVGSGVRCTAKRGEERPEDRDRIGLGEGVDERDHPAGEPLVRGGIGRCRPTFRFWLWSWFHDHPQWGRVGA